MWTWLAWFITFNFINIAWVFFRAKEWDNVINILSGMIGFNGINLPNPLLNKLSFLQKYGIEFGGWISNIDNSYGGIFVVTWLIIGFILILLFKNSVEKLDSFKFNYKTSFFSGIAFSCAVLSLNKVSEFLYFNF